MLFCIIWAILSYLDYGTIFGLFVVLGYFGDVIYFGSAARCLGYFRLLHHLSCLGLFRAFCVIYDIFVVF